MVGLLLAAGADMVAARDGGRPADRAREPGLSAMLRAAHVYGAPSATAAPMAQPRRAASASGAVAPASAATANRPSMLRPRHIGTTAARVGLLMPAPATCASGHSGSSAASGTARAPRLLLPQLPPAQQEQQQEESGIGLPLDDEGEGRSAKAACLSAHPPGQRPRRCQPAGARAHAVTHPRYIAM